MPSCKRERSRSIRATPQRIGARRRTDNLSLQRAKPILTPSHCVSEPIPVVGYLQLGASEDGIGPKRGGPSHPTVSVSTGSLDRSLFPMSRNGPPGQSLAPNPEANQRATSAYWIILSDWWTGPWPVLWFGFDAGRCNTCRARVHRYRAWCQPSSCRIVATTLDATCPFRPDGPWQGGL